ncbi:zinc-dependent alcohol dehydrogenase [Ruminococcus gauvreauii]|uniref:zinc-dependent alcohol dehydrogenase n=1 Tax=Ruminococcus gauvreauii TaxID=438033 RepID=UPI003983F1C1
MDKMLAAVFKGNGVLELEKRGVPKIERPTDVRVKVTAAGICGSDLHVLHVPPAQYAKPGTVMGHEFYGVVDAIGDEVTQFAAGDTVVVDNIEKCHVCEYCRRGMDNLCPDAEIYGQTKPGGFAQYAVIPQAQLFHMLASVRPELAAQTEPLSCVMNGMRKINPMPSQRVLLYGAGPIGLTFIKVLKLYGVKQLAVCEMAEDRRAWAKKCGADLVIDPSGEPVGETVMKEWGGMFDIVIDAVGAGAVFGEAVNLLNAGGKLLIFGQNANAVSQVPPAVITRNELTVMGTYCAHNTFPYAIDLLQDERLGLEEIVSHKLELKDILTGIQLLREQKACRVIIYPNGIV